MKYLCSVFNLPDAEIEFDAFMLLSPIPWISTVLACHKEFIKLIECFLAVFGVFSSLNIIITSSSSDGHYQFWYIGYGCVVGMG